jgi:paired amphipathic helix protein Sin3a
MKRLQQKQSEWQGLKKEMMPIWTDVYKKNYAKSLDHQSFYFKQMDKKALSAKGMTQEIKDLNDKKKTADENVGRGMPPIEEPDLELDFSDARVHDDVYAVIKFSTREMLSVEQGERVLTLYRNFLESFFNVTRSGADDFKDSAAEAAANFVRGTEQEDVKKLNETKKNESDADEDEDEDDKMRVSSARKAARPDVKDEEDEDMEESEEEEEKDFTNCKPASGIIDEAEASAKVPLRALKRNVFYANDAIYHMFRPAFASL